MSDRAPLFELLAASDVERIVSEACRVLWTVGVLVENQEASHLLLDAGASSSGDRLLIPERLVRDALASAPHAVQLFDRAGQLALDLGGSRVHFDPGSCGLHMLDAATHRRRDATTADLVAIAQLVEGLPHYAAQSTALSPSDVPRELADRWRLAVALHACAKPVVTGTFRKDGFAPMLAMLVAVRGGAAELADKPLAIFDCCPSPPLKWSDLTAQALMDCARARVPATLVSMPLTGAASPVTLREAVVQHCAENLSGVVLHQLAGKGSPVLYGGAPSAFDMRQGTTPMGAAETMLIDIGAAQVGRHLGLPTHGYLALSDAKVPDYQSGMETASGAVLAALAGINLVSGPGMLDFVLTQSLEKLVLDHEACAMALRLASGIRVSADDPVALMADLVKSGSLLGHPHTRKHWRGELMIPSAVIDRGSYGDWEAAGGKWAHERAAADAERRRKLPSKSALTESQSRALHEILREEASRWGAEPLPRIELGS